MKRIPYSYCIFYIERKYYQNINKELKEKGYKKVRAIIPTINVLKKTAKGRSTYLIQLWFYQDAYRVSVL